MPYTGTLSKITIFIAFGERNAIMTTGTNFAALGEIRACTRFALSQILLAAICAAPH